ncbi:MAG: hypothetical protein A3F12_03005 [Gammaproteobacteria bacterium RIFCSPHIGHO2_12_FULL_38_14]|nr:MAG: hypothetical protein A3F12_03005 [Gammaproteobacteria bacterium RIFCSPHIGHO2_12_FULL_38_14]
MNSHNFSLKEADAQLEQVRRAKEALLTQQENLEQNAVLKKKILIEKARPLRAQLVKVDQEIRDEAYKTLWGYRYLPISFSVFATALLSGSQTLNESANYLDEKNKEFELLCKEWNEIQGEEKSISVELKEVNDRLLQIINQEISLLNKIYLNKASLNISSSQFQLKPRMPEADKQNNSLLQLRKSN